MKILPLLLLTACAEPKTAPSCSIAEIKWDAASAGTSYDRQTSAELGQRLSSVTQSDRAAFQAGQPTGAMLGTLALASASTTIVSADVLALAVRLRQLDCAVERGSYARRPDLADKLFAEILAEANRLR